MRMTGLCGGLEHVDHARPCRRHELRLHWVAIHRCRALRYSRCRIGRVSCVPAVGAFNDYPASVIDGGLKSFLHVPLPRSGDRGGVNRIKVPDQMQRESLVALQRMLALH